MKYYIATVIGLFFLFTNISCDKGYGLCFMGNFEYLAFGHFYGECGGEECVEMFVLEYQKVREETTDVYPTDKFYHFKEYEVLPDSTYSLVNDLIDHFPDELWDESGTVIGNPDGGDWGGIYVEIKNWEGHRYWLLDQMESNMPEEYNVYVDLINEKIALINQ